MKLRIYDPVVMALDLRHRRFGYAVFQGHKTLLEWGTRVYPAIGEAERELARRRLSKLLAGIQPDLILLKRERWERAQNDAHLVNPLIALQSEAQSRSIPLRLIPEGTIRSTFAKFGCETRHDIAEAIGAFFPEMLLSIPPRRRVWQAEHPRMSTFDAIALGMAYWLGDDNQIVVDRRM